LFTELKEHPKTGTGQVEQLKGELVGKWSRRITKGDRLNLHKLRMKRVFVTVVSLKGHYGDK